MLGQGKRVAVRRGGAEWLARLLVCEAFCPWCYVHLRRVTYLWVSVFLI